MRTPIAHFDNYWEARDLKHELQKKFEDKIFQVRRKTKGFVVVERTFPGNQEPITPSKKRKKRRGIFIEPDLQSYR